MSIKKLFIRINFPDQKFIDAVKIIHYYLRRYHVLRFEIIRDISEPDIQTIRDACYRRIFISMIKKGFLGILIYSVPRNIALRWFHFQHFFLNPVAF